MIQLYSYLREAPEVSYSLAHRQPPPLAALGCLDDLELVRIYELSAGE